MTEIFRKTGDPLADRASRSEVPRDSQATFSGWSRKPAAPLPDGTRRRQAVWDENGRLKKVVADLTLDLNMLQDVIRRNSRDPVGFAIRFASLAMRGRYGAVRSGRALFQCSARRSGQAFGERWIGGICETRVRYGCGSDHVLLRRENSRST